MHIYFRFLISVFFLAAVPCSANTPFREEELLQFTDNVNNILNQRNFETNFESKIAEQYDNVVGPHFNNNDSKTENELLLHFRASMIAFFYTHDKRYAATMEVCFVLLKNTGLLKKSHYDEMFSTYITMRDFKKANEFFDLYHTSKTEKFPVIVDTEQSNLERKIWHVNSQKKSLEAKTFIFRPGLKVVVLTSPRCHFFSRFFAVMQGNTKLSSLFRRHAIFLIPPEGTLGLETIDQWNQNNPDFPMFLIHKRNEWEEINLWETPVFYFFMNGKLVERVTGWPKEGHERTLELVFDRLIGSSVDSLDRIKN